jgi:hypothetical protein
VAAQLVASQAVLSSTELVRRPAIIPITEMSTFSSSSVWKLFLYILSFRYSQEHREKMVHSQYIHGSGMR